MLRKTSATSASAKSTRRRPPHSKRKRALRENTVRTVRPRTLSLSKKDRVCVMLRQPGGATVAAIMKATGWKKHTVRGFFSEVVRRRLGLELKSETTDGTRIYRVIEP